MPVTHQLHCKIFLSLRLRCSPGYQDTLTTAHDAKTMARKRKSFQSVVDVVHE